MKKTRHIRDEALDTLVYSMGIFDITPFSKNMDAIFETMEPETETKPTAPEQQPAQSRPRIIVRNR